MTFEFANVEHEIRLLLVAHPELADDEALRADMLEGETDFNKALSRIVQTIIETEATREGLKAFVAKLTARDERLERRVKALRSLIQKLLNIADLKKVPLPEATLSIGRAPRFVVVTDETSLTDEFIRIKREPNKTAIKEAIENGRAVAGAELSNGGESLTIRMS